MRILRYRGNTYNSPEPVVEAPRPGERSYRWVQYAIPSNNVVPLKQSEDSSFNNKLAA
jgi:hypothetical protein